ncbi:MAG: hypothetical protein ACYDAR_22195 [Thermomicrobiales bacterium]
MTVFLRPLWRTAVVSLVAALALSFSAGPPIGAVGTHCVNTTGVGGCFTSIQAAINDAGTVNGDTITVAANTVSVPTYNERVTVSKNLTITGAGATSILDGSGVGVGTTLTVSASVIASMSGLVIRNGSASNVVIAAGAIATLTNCTITGGTEGFNLQGAGINGRCMGNGGVTG